MSCCTFMTELLSLINIKQIEYQRVNKHRFSKKKIEKQSIMIRENQVLIKKNKNLQNRINSDLTATDECKICIVWFSISWMKTSGQVL